MYTQVSHPHFRDLAVTGYFTTFPDPQVVGFIQKDDFISRPHVGNLYKSSRGRPPPPGSSNPNPLVLLNYLYIGMDFAENTKIV
jgi:hypothetical protein